MKTNSFEGIAVSGYRGRWSEVDSYTDCDGTQYVLLEHDTYGDETFYLVCRVDGDDIVFICETYDDIETSLADCEII